MDISLVIKSYTWSLKSIFTSRKLLSYCLFPWVLALFFIILSLGTCLIGYLNGYFDFTYAITWCAVAILTTVLLSILLNEWLFEKFILCLIERSTLIALSKRSFLGQIWDAFVRSIFLLIFTICSFIFGILPFTQPISILIVGLGFGFAFYDTVLSAGGYSLSKRLAIINQNLGNLIVCGLFFTPTIIIPFASLFLLPIGYASAVYLLGPPDDLMKSGA